MHTPTNRMRLFYVCKLASIALLFLVKIFGICMCNSITCAFYFPFVGTAAYDKLKALLTKTRLLNDIKQMSPDAQTSCLEGFHATLNYWHPKLICFSWLGSLHMYVV